MAQLPVKEIMIKISHCRSKSRMPVLMAFLIPMFLLMNSGRIKAQLNASFSVTGATGCAPLNVQFSNTSSGSVSWFWDFGNGNTSVLANPSEIYMLPGSYTVKLVSYDANGNTDSVIQNNVITVIQQPLPSFNANVTSACEGNNNIQFTNTSAWFDSCLWDFGDGVTSSLLNPSHTYTGPGVYSVTLICFNSAYGCQESHTRNQYITIGAKPVVTVSVNRNTTCDVNQPFNFTAVSSNGINYLWNFGDNTGTTQQNPSHVYGAAGIYTVTLITTSSMGCRDTQLLNQYIEVKNNPVPGMLLNDSAGCLPFWITHSTIGTSFSSCLWTFGDGDSSVNPSASHPYQTAGTYTITLYVTYYNGCTNSNSYNNIQALTTPDASISLNNNEGCRPLTVQCVNSSSNATSYLWDFGDGTTSTAFAPSHTYTQNGIYYVKLTAMNSNGCSDVTLPYTVKVKGPGANIFADVNAGCPPLLVHFNANPVMQSSYFWDFGDGTTSLQANPQHTFLNQGTYAVRLAVTNAFGCTDTVTTPTFIQVAMPSGNFNPQAPVSGCIPMTINLSDNTPGAASWTWDFGDGTTGNGQQVTHTYTVPGTYSVNLNTGSAGGGCSQTITNFATFIAGGGVAGFSYNQSLCPPYTAWFQDTSTNAVSWFWDFGDGNTSNLQNPNHIYLEPGYYNVSLTITTADGCQVTCMHNYAMHFQPLIANATAFTTDTALPMTVNFYANSTGATWWLWSFGDSTTSTLENPVHTYTIPGPYNITLTIGNDSCTYTYNYPPTNIGVGSGGLSNQVDSVHAPPPYAGCAPMGVNFHNPFFNTVSWLWDFGDGQTSTLSDPTHVYLQPGLYDVTLYAIRSNGITDSLIQPGAVLVSGSVDADFNIAYAGSCTGTVVSLSVTDSTISNFQWDFGDGTASTLPNPVHTYPNNGTNYFISLSASDSSGCRNFMTQSFFTGSGIPLHPSKKNVCAGDTVYFDSGNLQFSSYTWHFGDGDSSLQQQAWHLYGDTGTYPVTLTVTDSSGCSMTIMLADPVQVYNPQAAFSLNYGVSCVGLSVTLNNLSVHADQYFWDFGDGTSTTQTSPVHVYNIPGNYTLSLTAFKNNCSSTYTMPVPVFVPNTTVDFSYTQDQQCLPINITCTDLSTDVTSWFWEFGDGTTSALQNPTHTFTTAPAGDIILHVENVYGCKLLKKLPNITATIAAFNLNDSAGCAPLSLSFLDSSSHASSWFWNFGDGQSSTLASPLHTYQQDGYYNVTLIVQGPSGCRDTIQADSLVHISSVHAGFISNKTADCAPAVINFTDTSVQAISWNWSFGDGSSSQLQHPTHIYTTPGWYDVSLVVGNADGCMDSMLVSQMIRVNGTVTGFMASGTGGCSPVTIQFTDTSANAFTWQWNFGDGSLSTVTNPSHLYSSPGQYTVSLITADSLGCQSVFTSPFTIHVNVMPEAAFAVSDSIGCTPLQVHFQNASTGFDSLYWNFGDGNSTVSTGSVSHTYTVAGTYYPYLVAYTAAGCYDTAASSNPVTVVLQPTADFTGGNIRGCAPLQVSFTNLSTSVSGGSAYFWDFGNGDTSIVPNPVYTYLVPGIYTVTLTVTNQGLCSSTYTRQAYIQVYDNNPPPVSPILRVSVADDSRVEIQWQNSSVTDLGAYVLYRLDPSSGQYVHVFTDTNPGNSSIYPSSTYIEPLLNTLQHTYTYKLQTVDLCGNALPLDSLNPHTTINLSAQTQGKNISLSWTSYGGCGISLYEIYRQELASGNYLKIGDVPSTQHAWVDTGLICPELYAYRVTATNICGNTYTSHSDTSMAKPENALNDQHVEVVRTTVIDDENTLTEWKPPLLFPDQVIAYNIYRSENETGPFTLVGTVGPSVFNFMDHTAEVHVQHYFYNIEVVNSCNSETLLSNIGSSILLLANPENTVTRLIWTAYKGWDSGVARYIIEKQRSDGSWETIKVVDGSTLETTDQ